MKKIFLIFFVSLFLLSLISATQESLGTFKAGENIQIIQLCGTCTYNNITSLIYNPTSTTILSSVAMIQTGSQYSYILNGTNTTEMFGTYIVNGIGDLNGNPQSWAVTFEITPNGQQSPGDNFNLFIYILFGFVFFFSFFFMILNIAKLATASETIFGLALSWCVYFLMLFNSWIIVNYSVSSFLRDNISWVIASFGFTNFLLPLISMFISFFKRGTEKRRPLNVQELTGRGFMRYG